MAGTSILFIFLILVNRPGKGVRREPYTIRYVKDDRVAVATKQSREEDASLENIPI